MGGHFDGRQEAPADAPPRSNRMAVARAGSHELLFTMPRWRFDLLHPVDLVEELAIGHGYEDLGTDRPRAPLTALPREDHHLRRRLREAMQGLGMLQIQSLTLSNENDQFTNMRWSPTHEVTAITNPITVDHTILRQHLIPGLVKLLASNRHHDLPQSVYELGTVVRIIETPTDWPSLRRNEAVVLRRFEGELGPLYGPRRLFMACRTAWRWGRTMARRTGCETDHQRRMGGMLRRIRPRHHPSVRPPRSNQRRRT